MICSPRPVAALLLLLIVGLSAPAFAALTILDVLPDEAAARSGGVAAGDRLLAAGSIDGPWVMLDHPLDLVALDFGPGRVQALRLRLHTPGDDQEPREIELSIGPLGLHTAREDDGLRASAEPAFSGALASGDSGAAITAWTAAVEAASPSPRTRCWAGLHLVMKLAGANAFEAATAEAASLDVDCRAASDLDLASARAAAAEALRLRATDVDAIAGLYRSATEGAQSQQPLIAAGLSGLLGGYLGRHGRLDEADVALERAVTGYDGVAPTAWGRAEALANRGVIDSIRGRFDQGRERLEDALASIEALEPGSLAVSSQQINLAILLRRLGEIEAARALSESALAIRQRLAPDTAMVAQSLNNLGVLVKNQGDLVAAERYFSEALELHKRLDSPSLARASVLGNLANLALERLDPEASLDRHREILALLEPIAPNHRFMVTTRLSLGLGELMRGRLDAAQEQIEAARTLQETIGTEAPIYAAILEALGRLARERQRPVEARTLLNQALELRRTSDPGSLNVAAIELALAEVDAEAGALDSALGGYKQAAVRAAQRAPGSLVEARAQHARADWLWQNGDHEVALTADAAAVDAFERQRERIGGDWLQRMRFGAGHRSLYVDAIERRLAAGRPAEAFAIQERYRAYERRQLLAGRVPVPALETAMKEVDELAAELSGSDAILGWVVGEQATWSFLLSADGLKVRELVVSETELRDQIDAVGVLFSVTRPTAAQRQALNERAQRLHQLLIAPWDASLTAVQRLVLIPDQALHRLPFAALQDGATDSYLVERFALVYAASASVYLEALDQVSGNSRVVAIGDPDLSGFVTTQNDAARSGLPSPLPAARAEVNSIASLYPGRTLRLVGREATEFRVRAALSGTGLLHFAAHAVVDGARPLDAYVQLASSPDESDDGRLTAWEVLSQHRLDADLVTLSACRTARGRTLGGDGVLGLSQAFQLAGAKAVLASLWNVPDQVTSQLMTSFYRTLAEGEDAASALRTAQLEVLARQRARSEDGVLSRMGRWLRRDSRPDAGPFEWAAFRLDGHPARLPVAGNMGRQIAAEAD